MNVGRETFEFMRNDHVAEVIVDDVDFDPLVCFALKMLLERLSGLVAFPDKRFQIDTFLSAIYGGKHSVIKVAAKIINLECIFANLDSPEMRVRKRFIMLIL